VAAVAGIREIMELGSIEFVGRERLFLLSTTHGAEMSGLGAFVKTVEMLQRDHVVDHIWAYGRQLMDLINSKAAKAGISEFFKANGVACSPWYATYDHTGSVSPAFRTLFLQEMIKQGVLMPCIALCFRHGDRELEKTSAALEKAFHVYAQAIEQGSTNGLLQGDVIKPVFRQYN
jgi:glutamate-1-semialdehyde 2,1-aminomutase